MNHMDDNKRRRRMDRYKEEFQCPPTSSQKAIKAGDEEIKTASHSQLSVWILTIAFGVLVGLLTWRMCALKEAFSDGQSWLPNDFWTWISWCGALVPGSMLAARFIMKEHLLLLPLMILICTEILLLYRAAWLICLIGVAGLLIRWIWPRIDRLQ